ncbi:MAG: glycosyltransferase family 2 protein [Anaerotruncus sp.]|nr:glycosyltransferase family 2 protein [Anaerotruncus sp.]
MNEVLISVIIPVYNVETYLAECLDSVCSQTLQNIEIICVDDCSTDASRVILKEYAEKDFRVKVIFKECNEGTLRARNTAVAQARGEYILFLDSDDYIKEDTCQVLYQKAKTCRADILQYGGTVLNCANLAIGRINGMQKYFEPYHGTLYGKDILATCFEKGGYNSNLAMKLLRTELYKKAMENMPSLNACMAEDLLAYFVIAYYAEIFVGLPGTNYYCYCYGRGLTGRSGIDLDIFKRYCTQATIAESLKDFLEQQGAFQEYSVIYTKIEKRLVDHCISSWRRLTPEEREVGLQVFIDTWGAERTLRAFLQESFVPSAQVMPNVSSVKWIMLEYPRDKVLQEFRQGQIGFRYIWRYFKAWLKYKIRR